MKYIYSILLVCFFTHSFSQEEDDGQLFYSITFDNPEFTWLGAGVNYDLDVNNYNFTLLGLGFNGMFTSKYFSTRIDSRYHFGERITEFGGNGEPISESIYLPENSNDITFEASFYALDKTETVPQRIKLKSVGNTDYVTDVDAKLKTTYALELGFTNGFTYYNFGDATFDGIDEEGNSRTFTSKDENRAIATYLEQKIVKVGFGRFRTSRFTANFNKGYGDRSVFSYGRIYGHMFIGFNQNLDDILFPIASNSESNGYSKEHFQRYSIDNSVNKGKIGGAIGYESYAFGSSKPLTFSWLAELGVLPGPNLGGVNNIVANSYLKFKLRLMFGKLID